MVPASHFHSCTTSAVSCVSKTNPETFDWMDGRNNPSRGMLRSPETRTEIPKAQQQEHNNNSCVARACWEEMLSLEQALASLEAGNLSQPSHGDFTCILHKCTQERHHAYAIRLHAYMHKSGLDTHPSLANHLVSMLAEVGSMADARQLFDKLVYQRETSWNSLIKGYVRCGESRQALILYQKMQEDESVCPSSYAFVSLLKACAELKDLEKGRRIHTDIVRKGLLERDIVVSNALVSMYAKCGSLAKAQEVFDKLPARDVVSWNALIAGYAKHKRGREALECFDQMRNEGISPNAVTFVCSLMACGNLGATDKGREIHAEIARKGLLQTNLRVGNALIDMYAKCGLLVKAQEVFDKVPARNLASWNALIAGYAQHGCSEEALNCFEQMQLKGISPNAVTLVCSLKACASLRAADKGHKIHAEIARKGLLERDLHIGNALVDMYAKCGLLTKAQDVFDKLAVRDVVSWTSLITGYADHGCGEQALNCFELMKYEGISPDSVTFACSLKVCASIGATDKGQEIHAEVAREGLLERDLIVGNALIDMYAKCGLLAKAQEVFNELPARDLVSWNALIGGYAQHGDGEEALNTFTQMQLGGVSPDAVTYVCSLKACGSIGAIDNGQEIHAEISRKGLLDKNLHVGNALVDMYAKCGCLAKAKDVFGKLPARDAVSWNALISGYAQHNHDEEALNCFEQMQREGVSPDAVTFVCSLKSCGSIGATDKGREIHAEISRKGVLEQDPAVGSTLVDMYAKCGSLHKAQEVFDKLPIRDEASWTALIAGYAQLGRSDNVFYIFDRMIGEGIKPNLVTFTSVLNACNHAGLVDKGQTYFEAMRKDYRIIPSLEHHTCMFDLLGRAGQLEKAIAMIMNMPFHPDLVVWHAVLGACQKWGNVGLGRQAFEYALRLDEKDSAAYVCMSNIYADAGMLEDADKVEAMRVAKQA